MLPERSVTISSTIDLHWWSGEFGFARECGTMLGQRGQFGCRLRADRTCRSPPHEIAANAEFISAPHSRRVETERVAHAFLLGPQIGERVHVRRGLAGQLVGTLDPVLAQRAGFARIVREQANALDAA